MYQRGKSTKDFLNTANLVMQRYRNVQAGLIPDDRAYLKAVKFPDICQYDPITNQVIRAAVPDKPANMFEAPPPSHGFTIPTIPKYDPYEITILTDPVPTCSSKDTIIVQPDGTLIIEF